MPKIMTSMTTRTTMTTTAFDSRLRKSASPISKVLNWMRREDVEWEKTGREKMSQDEIEWEKMGRVTTGREKRGQDGIGWKEAGPEEMRLDQTWRDRSMPDKTGRDGEEDRPNGLPHPRTGRNQPAGKWMSKLDETGQAGLKLA